MVFEELGASLYETLMNNDFEGFSLVAVKKVMYDVLLALNFMHSAGWTHTDLKPENILFESTETVTHKGRMYIYYISFRLPASFNVKIIDFGGATYKNEAKAKVINTR